MLNCGFFFCVMGGVETTVEGDRETTNVNYYFENLCMKKEETRVRCKNNRYNINFFLSLTTLFFLSY